jgi:hypothetical protein
MIYGFSLPLWYLHTFLSLNVYLHDIVHDIYTLKYIRVVVPTMYDWSIAEVGFHRYTYMGNLAAIRVPL